MEGMESIGDLLDYNMDDIECRMEMNHFEMITLCVLGSVQQHGGHWVT